MQRQLQAHNCGSGEVKVSQIIRRAKACLCVCEILLQLILRSLRRAECSIDVAVLYPIRIELKSHTCVVPFEHHSARV
jgi:hypothetical protein